MVAGVVPTSDHLVTAVLTTVVLLVPVGDHFGDHLVTALVPLIPIGDHVVTIW